MITVSQVTKKYAIKNKSNDRTITKNKLSISKDIYISALNNVSFEVKSGEIFGIIGPNGAGKTTLIKVIAGLLIPDEGGVIVNNFDIIKDREKVRQSINILMSGGWMIFDYQLSVKFNLKYWGVLNGLSLKGADDRVDEVLKIIGLEKKGNDFPENLSAGMRQMMNLGRCLLVDRAIYLLDEPTVNMDSYSANKIREFIKSLSKEKGKTIILATHNLWEAETLCDRILILNEGKVLLVDDVDSIKGMAKKEIAIIESTAEINQSITNHLKTLPYIDKIIIEQNKIKIFGDIKRNLPEILDKCKNNFNIYKVDIMDISLNEIFTELINKERMEGGIENSK
jgi:ABC-2 type transport system ATP-binding protein